MSELIANDYHVATANLINETFCRLASICPAHKQAWPTQEILDGAKRELMKLFIETKINTQEQIDRGLDECLRIGDRFPPSPGEFIGYCKPQPAKLGAPSYYQAFEEAKSRAHPSTKGDTWSHPAVYHAYIETGAVKVLGCMRTSQEQAIKKIFDSNYNMALQMLSRGEPLRELPKLIDKPKFVKEITRAGRDALEALKAI